MARCFVLPRYLIAGHHRGHDGTPVNYIFGGMKFVSAVAFLSHGSARHVISPLDNGHTAEATVIEALTILYRMLLADKSRMSE